MGRHITGIIRSYRKFSMSPSDGYCIALIDSHLPAYCPAKTVAPNGCMPTGQATPHHRANCAG
jgi:hypothetical protein